MILSRREFLKSAVLGLAAAMLPPAAILETGVEALDLLDPTGGLTRAYLGNWAAGLWWKVLEQKPIMLEAMERMDEKERAAALEGEPWDYPVEFPRFIQRYNR